MHRLLELLLPAKLGRPFRRIFAAAGAANLGDGILLAAGPLLVAQLTRDPLLVALALVAQQAPWFVVGILAGVVADRVPRVQLLVASGTLRVLALVGIAALLLTGALGLWPLYALLFVIGVGEVFYDNAWGAVVPDAVPQRHLGVANARIGLLLNVGNQLLGPAIGGALFAFGAIWPISSTAVLVALGVVILLRLRVAPPPRPDAGADAQGRPSLDTAAISLGGTAARARHDFTSGMRWLWGHVAVRTLFIAITALNVTWGMSWGVLVLYATERLGLDATGYGVLLACSAVGGIAGSLSFGHVEGRFGYGTIMRCCLALEILLHGALALTTHPVVAGAILVVFGFYATLWGTTSMTVRGRATPSHVRGRVTSVYLVGMFGGVSLGAPIGGAIGQRFGVVATMWVACAATAVIVALVWRMLPMIGRAGAADGDACASAARARPVRAGDVDCTDGLPRQRHLVGRPDHPHRRAVRVDPPRRRHGRPHRTAHLRAHRARRARARGPRAEAGAARRRRRRRGLTPPGLRRHPARRLAPRSPPRASGACVPALRGSCDARHSVTPPCHPQSCERPGDRYASRAPCCARHCCSGALRDAPTRRPSLRARPS